MHNLRTDLESRQYACERCGTNLPIPQTEDALIDEAGGIHIRCSTCSQEMVLPYIFGPESADVLSGRPNYVMFADWVARAILITFIIALILVLWPVVHHEYEKIFPPPRPEQLV